MKERITIYVDQRDHKRIRAVAKRKKISVSLMGYSTLMQEVAHREFDRKPPRLPH